MVPVKYCGFYPNKFIHLYTYLPSFIYLDFRSKR